MGMNTQSWSLMVGVVRQENGEEKRLVAVTLSKKTLGKAGP